MLGYIGIPLFLRLLLDAAAGPAIGPEPGVPVAATVSEEMAQHQQATYWVVLKEQADLSRARGIKSWKSRGQGVYAALTSHAASSQSGLVSYLNGRGIPYQSFWVVNAIRLTSGPGDLAQIRRRNDVKEIRADTVYTIPSPRPGSLMPQVAGVEWNVARIDAPQVWSSFGLRGEGIVVASIDTGVQFDHPALATQYRGYRGPAGFDHNYNWFDPSRVCVNPTLPCDNNGHGTHTMGTMVGDDGAGNQIGVAPRAQWIAAKGCEMSTCSSGALASAAQWILAPTDLNGANPRPDLRPNVVNNSWGGGRGDPFFQDFVRAWIAAGIFPAFANGNAGPNCGSAGSPGDLPESYASGAFGAGDVIASFSARGPSLFGGIVKPNIAAPGVDVRSSVPTSSYDVKSGTSMASPHTAATVALMWGASPSLVGQIDATRQILDQAAGDMPDSQCGGTPASNNVWGEGALDALAAVQQSPRGPAGALLGTVTDAASGLPIAGAVVRADGPITRAVTTDQGGQYRFPALTPGSYNVTTDAFGYLRQSASAQVADGGAAQRDFALISVTRYSLEGSVRDTSGNPIANAVVTIVGTPLTPATTNAAGSYSFGGVPPGTYDVRAEEARCFAPQTRPLVLSGNVTGFDFTATERTDAFGYSCGHVTPAYVEAGTIIGVDYDTTQKTVSLPFPFTYYGHPYQDVLVCASGTLSFGESSSLVPRCYQQLCNDPVPLFSHSSPDGTIYPFWGNLSVPSDSVRTESLGSAPDRRFVIEWRHVGVQSILPIDFEVILHESGLIETQYRNIDEGDAEKGSCATIGIEDQSGSVGLQYSFHQPAIQAPQHAVVYRPPPLSRLEGMVTDANDGLPIQGATIRSLRDRNPLVTVTTDAAGHYEMQLPQGGYTIEGSKATSRFSVESAPLSVAGGVNGYRQDFALKSARVEVSPASLAFSLLPGETGGGSVLLRNAGSLQATFSSSEIGAAGPSAPGTILASWTPSIVPSGLGYDGRVWIASSGDGRNHAFNVDGSPTGTSWPAAGGDLPRDMAYDPARQWMCQLTAQAGVSRAGIACWDPSTGAPEGSIFGTFPWVNAGALGLAYRAEDDTFYVGGRLDQGLDGTFYHVAGFSHAAPGEVLGQCVATNTWSTVHGLAWNGAFGTLWAAMSGGAEMLNAYDPETCKLETLLTLPCCATGLDMNEAGQLWLGATGPQKAYLIESGLPGPTDVPWLSSNLASGALMPNEERAGAVTIGTAGLATGIYQAALAVRTNSEGGRNIRLPVTLEVTNQPAYRGQPFDVPAFIQAEDFDRGGEGIAYHDNVPGNAGGQYRPGEDVDVIAPYAGGYVVNNFETGEWMEYSINVPQAGDYRLQALASSEFVGSRMHMEIDGLNATGPMQVPNTGSWGSFQWVNDGVVSLSAGRHVLRVQVEQPYFNIDAIGILANVGSPAPAGDVGDTLRVLHGQGGQITLSWGSSCAAGDDDYEIYEGTLGAFYSHVSRFCTTAGATSLGLTPSSQNSYYLVVPRNPQREGSYGLSSAGTERPPGNAACVPKQVAASCP